MFTGYVEHVHKPENVVRIIHCRDVRQTSPILAEHAFKGKPYIVDTVIFARF